MKLIRTDSRLGYTKNTYSDHNGNQYTYMNQDVKSVLDYTKNTKRDHNLGHHVARLPMTVILEYMNKNGYPYNMMNEAIEKMLQDSNYSYFKIGK